MHVGQDFRENLSEWFGFRTFQEVAIYRPQLHSLTTAGYYKWILVLGHLDLSTRVSPWHGIWLLWEWIFQKGAREKSQCLFPPSLRSDMHPFWISSELLRPILFSMGGGPHKGTNTRRQISLKAILETGYPKYTHKKFHKVLLTLQMRGSLLFCPFSSPGSILTVMSMFLITYCSSF